MNKVSFYTLGCKLNQSETASLTYEFIKRGYTVVPFGTPCDVCVINTCTVTAKTDRRNHKIIRQVMKLAPHAIVAVVGCYAQMAGDQLIQYPSVRYVLGSDKKFDIFHYLENRKTAHVKGQNQKFIATEAASLQEQTRAFLKIQDGCDNLCSYCIVPYARGRSRSATLEHIEKNAQQLVQNGHKEIVLTGVHIGSYGKELIPPLSLIDVLKKLESIPQLERIRLSSIELLELDAPLIELIAHSPKICPHLHIPLQSGDDFILKQMKRNYTVTDYVKKITQVIRKIPDIGVGTDIIVGFPGETEQHFKNTYQLVQELPFTYLHVFAFSSRSGTVAALLPEKIAPDIKKERSAQLIDLGKKKKQDFYSQAIGKNFKVLFEGNNHHVDRMYGFTGNYIRVQSGRQPSNFNKIATVKITHIISGRFAFGKIIE